MSSSWTATEILKITGSIGGLFSTFVLANDYLKRRRPTITLVASGNDQYRKVSLRFRNNDNRTLLITSIQAHPSEYISFAARDSNYDILNAVYERRLVDAIIPPHGSADLYLVRLSKFQDGGDDNVNFVIKAEWKPVGWSLPFLNRATIRVSASMVRKLYKSALAGEIVAEG